MNALAGFLIAGYIIYSAKTGQLAMLAEIVGLSKAGKGSLLNADRVSNSGADAASGSGQQ